MMKESCLYTSGDANIVPRSPTEIEEVRGEINIKECEVYRLTGDFK